jgi:hypothetical protein
MVKEYGGVITEQPLITTNEHESTRIVAGSNSERFGQQTDLNRSRVYIHASLIAGKKYRLDFRADSHAQFEHRIRNVV